MPPATVTPKKMPFEKYQRFVPLVLTDRTWPDVVVEQGPAVVQRRPARRQPGAHRPDGPPAQAAHVRRAGEDGLQGDRGRLPVGQPARLRLRPPADRGGPDPRRRHDPGAGAVPPGADRAHLRGAAGRPAGDRALLQLHQPAAARGGVRPRQGRASSTSRSTAPSCARSWRRRSPTPQIRYEYSPESFTLTEPEFAIEICHAVMDVIEPTPERPIDPQPAGHGRVLHAQRVRRRDRVVRPPHPPAATAWSSACTRTTTAAPARPPPSWACWPAPTASRARCSATASAPATSTSSTWRSTCSCQGVDPELDISDIDALRRVAEYCNRLPVHPRHPWVGDLVYTAFSGSHQDAIKKGFEALDAAGRGQRRRVHRRGACPTCRSTRSTSAAPTRPSSGSTARAARAAWPT